MTHLDDLESDFSRFHRVDDVRSLSFARFYRMACRLWLYGGVMAAVHRQQQQAPQGPAQGAQQPRAAGAQQIPGLQYSPGARVVPLRSLPTGAGRRGARAPWGEVVTVKRSSTA